MKTPCLGLLPFLAAVVTTVHAADVSLHFDSVPSGSRADLAAPGGIRFHPAVYLPLFNGDGEPVPGSDFWQIDAESTPITVDEPASFGRGAAASGANALNAVFQPVMVRFDSPSAIRRFAVTLDADSLGARLAEITFWSSDHRWLGSLEIDQRTPGFSIDAAMDLASVSQVILPAGAFYDNLLVSSIPEPQPKVLLLAGLIFGVGRRILRRSS